MYITTLWLCLLLTSEEARADYPLSIILLSGSAFSYLRGVERWLPSVYITTLWLCVLLTSEEARADNLCLHYYSLALRSPYLRGGGGGVLCLYDYSLALRSPYLRGGEGWLPSVYITTLWLCLLLTCEKARAKLPSVYITTLWLCVLLTSEEVNPLSTLLLSFALRSPHLRGGEPSVYITTLWRCLLLTSEDVSADNLSGSPTLPVSSLSDAAKWSHRASSSVSK